MACLYSLYKTGTKLTPIYKSSTNNKGEKKILIELSQRLKNFPCCVCYRQAFINNQDLTPTVYYEITPNGLTDE